MPLEPGQLDSDFNFVSADCMAKHIDDAIAKLSPLPANLPPDALKAINHSQRNAWIAISTGVIEYLRAHAGDSFQITITPNPTNEKATLTIL